MGWGLPSRSTAEPMKTRAIAKEGVAMIVIFRIIIIAKDIFIYAKAENSPNATYTSRGPPDKPGRNSLKISATG